MHFMDTIWFAYMVPALIKLDVIIKLFILDIIQHFFNAWCYVVFSILDNFMITVEKIKFGLGKILFKIRRNIWLNPFNMFILNMV